MNQPNLTFFCELEAEPLSVLFADEGLIEKLKKLDARISLGILDFSQERVDVVKQLNKAGIPVSAWMLLPKEQGYWLNLDNAPQAASLYGQFKNWSTKNKLKWAGIGLDIEPDIRKLAMINKNRPELIKQAFTKLINPSKHQKAFVDYRSLVTQIRCDGYSVESYQIPIIVDERKAGSTFIQHSTGLVDLSVDREVLMLYTSILRENGLGMLWSYARDAQAIGVGSTGGGVTIEGVENTQPLYWQELKRDLLLAFQHTDWIYIFSLEGCVQQGFLDSLIGFDWYQTVSLPLKSSQQVERVRKLSQGFLWFTARPWWLYAAIFGFIWFTRIRRKCC